MDLRIVVCVKPIPDPENYAAIQIDPVTKTIVRTGIKNVLNPVDKNAIEIALKIKEKHGGKVTLISMAPPNTQDCILDGLAMGADEAYLLSDFKFAGADTLATSYVLAEGIKKIGGADLVFTATESGDGATAQVSSQIGEWLEMPHLWGVIEMNYDDLDNLQIKTKVENGYMEWIGKAPMVMAIARELNKPRFASIMNVMKAKKKPFTVWGYDDFSGIDDKFVGLTGSPTQPGDLVTPDMSRRGEKVEGELEEQVAFILGKLRASGINVDNFAIGCDVKGGQA